MYVFIDVARASGVSQIVFISVAGAGDNPLVPHHAVEQHIRAGQTGWTILRAGFFAQNIGDAYRQDIVSDKRIFLPAGAGRVAFLDVYDLAEVAVNALLDPASYRDRTYTLTRPEAYFFAEVASSLSQELARRNRHIIRYQQARILAYFLYLSKRGMPPDRVLIQTILHVGLRFGQAAAVNTSLADLLGHRSHLLHEYIRDNLDLWL